MLKRRIMLGLMGVVITALFAGVVKAATMGVDPYQAFVCGINRFFPVSLGTMYLILNSLLLIFNLICDRKNVGITTLINMFLVGYILDFSFHNMQSLFPGASLAMRIVFLAVGIVGMCLGCSLYMTADLGVSSYDAMAIMLAYKWKLGQFRVMRVICDTTCVVVGAALLLIGGATWREVSFSVGIGTIITAFFMGPLIDLFNRKVSQPLLNRKSSAKA